MISPRDIICLLVWSCEVPVIVKGLTKELWPSLVSSQLLRHRSHFFICGLEAQKLYLLDWEWGTEAIPTLLKMRHGGHTSFTENKAQRPYLLYWERDKSHTYFTGLKEQRTYLLYWEWGTEAVPSSLRMRHWDHTSFTENETQGSYLLYWERGTEATPPLLSLKHWGNTSFTRGEAQNLCLKRPNIYWECRHRGHTSINGNEAQEATPPSLRQRLWGIYPKHWEAEAVFC